MLTPSLARALGKTGLLVDVARCKSLSITALRPRQLSGIPGSVNLKRRVRITRAFTSP